MIRTALSFAALACAATTAQAVPVTYSLNFDFPGVQYYCVGCGGSTTPWAPPGGTVSGSITLDANNTGASQVVDFNFTSSIPEMIDAYFWMPGETPTYSYGDPYVTVGLSGNTFSFSNYYGYAASGNGTGWRSFFYMTVADLGDIGGRTLDASFQELYQYSSIASTGGFYGTVYRHDNHGINVGPGNGSAYATTLTANVPLPAGGLLLLGGLVGLGLARRRKTS
ncbi:VPLPA-CTERM sorting domain-containing protein [Tropicibacter sp. S64]|uniref:VPLPA-CTERM sorting domain-containing protein n=1 Tax=Tropicibacter sp. S64 TaxID=3415122 RepID=UPI003C7C279D